MTQDEYRRGPTLPCGHSDAFYHHHRCLKCDKHGDYERLEHIRFYECCNVGAWDCPFCQEQHHSMEDVNIKVCMACGSQFTRQASGLYSVADQVTRIELLMGDS